MDDQHIVCQKLSELPDHRPIEILFKCANLINNSEALSGVMEDNSVDSDDEFLKATANSILLRMKQFWKN